MPGCAQERCSFNERRPITFPASRALERLNCSCLSFDVDVLHSPRRLKVRFPHRMAAFSACVHVPTRMRAPAHHRPCLWRAEQQLPCLHKAVRAIHSRPVHHLGIDRGLHILLLGTVCGVLVCNDVTRSGGRQPATWPPSLLHGLHILFRLCSL